jgi:predicted transcriptional regulator
MQAIVGYICARTCILCKAMPHVLTHAGQKLPQRAKQIRRTAMKVSDILRVKGNTLYTVSPDESLAAAVQVMSEKDIGSLVVMDHGDVVGMLTFREVIRAL